jgi:hypothetical protein
MVEPMRGLLQAPMYAVLLGAAIASWTCSGNPPTAVLYLVVHGQGQVSVVRTKDPDACMGSGCSSSSADAGALEVSYASGTPVVLTAEPSPGWTFVSYQVSVSGGGPVASTSPSLEVENAGTGMSVLATFADGGAPADGGSPEGGPSAK